MSDVKKEPVVVPTPTSLSFAQLVVWLESRVKELDGDNMRARLNESFRLGQIDFANGLLNDLKSFDNIKAELIAAQAPAAPVK